MGVSVVDAIPVSPLAGARRAGQPMNARKRFIFLTLIMVGACAMVMAVMTAMLYRHDIKAHRERLQATVQSQARLIEAMARHDAVYEKNTPGGPTAATLNQIIDAHEHYEGFGETGEFTLARREGDFIVFIFRHRHGAVEYPASVAVNLDLSGPMGRALNGLSGTVIGRDYRGETVLAAHEPVAVLNLGIVMKIDLAEIRAPFIRTGLSAAAVALLVILTGTALFFRIGNPIIARLEEYSRDLEKEIVEHKRAEGALREYQIIVSNSTDMLALLSRHFVYLATNPAYLKAFKKTHDELIGHTVIDVFGEDFFKAVIKPHAELCLGGEEVNYQAWVDFPDYKSRYMDVTYTPCTNADDEIMGFVVIGRDITERKEAEETLRRQQAEQQIILNSVPAMIFYKDKENRFIRVNQALAEAAGMTIEEMEGESLFQLYPDLAEDYWRDDMEVMSTGKPKRHIIEPLETAEGKMWVETDKIPYRDLDGKIIGIIGFSLDITERKRTERARARLNAQLEAKNKELEQIVYVTSHDLRSPLVNIDGYGKELEYAIDDLRSALGSDKKPTEALEAADQLLAQDITDALRFIRTSTSKMDALLVGLLTLSRSGRAALTIDSLDMNDLMANVIEASKFQIKEAGAVLDIGDLPPCKGDAVQVNQVFSNLIGNALQYLDPERPGAIRISGRVEGERSVYCVKDNGIGIAPAHRQNIFEIFHRLDPAKSMGEGLGLTIVQQVLGRLWGKIWVESKLGEGSRFYVALPAVQKYQ